MIFILGSPRTGSTLIYQIMINFYNLFYFTNLTNNYFYKYPFIGSVLSVPFIKSVKYESDHGKTKGLFGPSEGSYIFKNWFAVGNKMLPDKKNHMVNMFRNIQRFIKRPIIIKNAWNCFRIPALAELLPNAMFIWIRRNIIDSAYSDLEARYFRKGPHVWNSAPTPNFIEIQKKPYWEQVVEQQYEYNKIIKIDLDRFYPHNYIELWYEDLCSNLDGQITAISNFFSFDNVFTNLPSFEIKKYSISTDFLKVSEYVKSNINRLYGYTK